MFDHLRPGRRARVAKVAVVGLAMMIILSAVPGVTALTSGKERKAETKLFDRRNAERLGMGLDPLVEHGSILSTVREHSVYMADTGDVGHTGDVERYAAIDASDAGIGPGEQCENVASTKGFTSPGKVAKAFFAFWKGSPDHNKCLFDGNGFDTTSAAVGIERRGKRWYGTFIAAFDSTP